MDSKYWSHLIREACAFFFVFVMVASSLKHLKKMTSERNIFHWTALWFSKFWGTFFGRETIKKAVSFSSPG
jgi:hypothetical protein